MRKVPKETVLGWKKQAAIAMRWGPHPASNQRYGLKSYRAIAEIVGMSISFCRDASLAFRENLLEMETKQRSMTRKGLRLLKEKKEKKSDLSQAHIAYITSPETLRHQTGMALWQRLAEFLNKFPDKKICLTTYRSIYKKHHIRNKRIKITKLPDRVVRLRIKRQTAFMAKQLHEMIDRGFRIIFLDETLITKSTIPIREWTPENQRVEIDFGQFSREVIAIIASISREAGVDLIMNFGRSVNKEKFKVYLEELRRRYFFDDICIVMDNLMVHKCNDVMDRLEELGMEYIFTPAYSPDFNPIESVFSIFKNRFKRMRINSIVHGREINYEAEIHRIFGLIEKEKVINCIDYA